MRMPYDQFEIGFSYTYIADEVADDASWMKHRALLKKVQLILVDDDDDCFCAPIEESRAWLSSTRAVCQIQIPASGWWTARTGPCSQRAFSFRSLSALLQSGQRPT